MLHPADGENEGTMTQNKRVRKEKKRVIRSGEHGPAGLCARAEWLDFSQNAAGVGLPVSPLVPHLFVLRKSP